MLGSVSPQILVFGRPDDEVSVSLRARRTWAEREDDARLDMRTGHVLWRPAAFMLSQTLAAFNICTRESRIVELGAGVALAATVACRRSAAFVVATDGAATVLDLALVNLSRNSSEDVDRHVATLRWGNDADTRSVKELLACRSKQPTASFSDCCDLVIGSDCFFPRPLDPDLTIFLQGRAMFETAARLMRPCSACERVRAEADSAIHSCGLLVTTFQIRRRGMNRELRAAATAVGLAIRFVDRECILQSAASPREASGAGAHDDHASAAGAGAGAEAGSTAPVHATSASEESAGSIDAPACSIVRFDPSDPMLRYVRLAVLAPCATALASRMAELGWRDGDPAEDDDDVPPPTHETLAGGLFPDSDDEE